MQPFTRFQLFTAVFYVILVISILKFLDSRIKIYYVGFLLIISLIASKSLRSNKYIPYSNYLKYVIKNEYPSYEYRDKYNPEHSPYSKKNRIF